MCCFTTGTKCKPQTPEYFCCRIKCTQQVEADAAHYIQLPSAAARLRLVRVSTNTEQYVHCC